MFNNKDSDKSLISEVFPAVRWAQSADKVFIEVKYAMRMDSPACLDIFDQNIHLKD